MSKYEEPSHSSELSNLPAWDRNIWLSRAYLEAGQCLSDSMLEGDFTSQYSSSRVILHLVRQGIELFLKGAVQAAGGTAENLGHNLDSLYVEYRRHHPDLAYHFEIPKTYQVDLNLDLFPESANQFHRTLDQRHRYATDKTGKTFATPEVFDPVATRDEIDELRRVLGIIEWVELRPSLQAKNAP